MRSRTLKLILIAALAVLPPACGALGLAKYALHCAGNGRDAGCN
jgi:hypothetical protein